MPKTVPKEHGGPHLMNLSEKVHLDVRGPTTPQKLYGKDYLVRFMDDYTHWSCVGTMGQKAEAPMCYMAYDAWLVTQHKAKLKGTQMDCGSEFLSHEFNVHLKAHRTVCSLTIYDTPK